jgi:hypothetical protein
VPSSQADANMNAAQEEEEMEDEEAILQRALLMSNQTPGATESAPAKNTQQQQ